MRWIKSAPVTFDLKRAFDENRKTKLIPSNGSTPRLRLLQRMITERTGSFLAPKLAEVLLRARLGVSASDDELRPWFSHSPTKMPNFGHGRLCEYCRARCHPMQHQQAELQGWQLRTTKCRRMDLLLVQQRSQGDASRFNPVSVSADARSAFPPLVGETFLHRMTSSTRTKGTQPVAFDHCWH